MALRIFLTIALALTLTGCGDDDSTPTDGGNGNETVACTTAADCDDGMTISIWYPTCQCSVEGDTMVCTDILDTPSGTGEWSCVEGACEHDFTVTQTDCAAEGKVCAQNPDDQVQGDACVDPPAEEG